MDLKMLVDRVPAGLISGQKQSLTVNHPSFFSCMCFSGNDPVQIMAEIKKAKEYLDKRDKTVKIKPYEKLPTLHENLMEEIHQGAVLKSVPLTEHRNRHPKLLERNPSSLASINSLPNSVELQHVKFLDEIEKGTVLKPTKYVSKADQCVNLVDKNYVISKIATPDFAHVTQLPESCSKFSEIELPFSKNDSLLVPSLDSKLEAHSWMKAHNLSSENRQVCQAINSSTRNSSSLTQVTQLSTFASPFTDYDQLPSSSFSVGRTAADDSGHDVGNSYIFDEQSLVATNSRHQARPPSNFFDYYLPSQKLNSENTLVQNYNPIAGKTSSLEPDQGSCFTPDSEIFREQNTNFTEKSEDTCPSQSSSSLSVTVTEGSTTIRQVFDQISSSLRDESQVSLLEVFWNYSGNYSCIFRDFYL